MQQLLQRQTPRPLLQKEIIGWFDVSDDIAANDKCYNDRVATAATASFLSTAATAAIASAFLI